MLRTDVFTPSRPFFFLQATNASDFHTFYEIHGGKGNGGVRWHVERLLQFIGHFSRLREKVTLGTGSSPG